MVSGRCQTGKGNMMGKIMRGSASLALVLLMAISTVIPVSAASSVGEQAFKSGEKVI